MRRGPTQTPRFGLSDQHLEFAHSVFFDGMGVTEAYRMHFPEKCFRHADSDKPLASHTIQEKAKALRDSAKMNSYIEYLGQPPEVHIEALEKKALHVGTIKERMAAADRWRARLEASKVEDPVEKWVQLMRGCGAEITVPVTPESRTVTVSLEDVLEGRARMSLPKEGELRLLRMSGAPWNEKSPNADISPLQIEMLSRKEKICVVEGGSGCGKSVLGGLRGLGLLALPKKKIGILGATYDHASSEFQYLYEGFLKLFGPRCATRIIYKNHKTHHDMEIQTIWGSSVVAHSLDRDGGAQMYGKEFDLVILAEASRISADAWWRAVFRGLQRRAVRMKICDCEDCKNPDHYWTPETGYALAATTPDGYEGASHAIVEMVEEKTERQPDKLHYENTSFQHSVYIRNADCLENPSYDPDAFQAAVDILPEDVVNEQYRGLAVARAGLIYKSFNRFRHLQPMPPSDRLAQMRLGVGGDTGKHSAFLLLGVEQDMKKWILSEVFNVATATKENSFAIMEMIVSFFLEQLGVDLRVDGVSDDAIQKTYQLLLDRVEIWNFDSACQSKEDYLDCLEAPIQFEKPELQGSIDRIDTWYKNDSLFVATIDGEPVAPNYVWEIERHKWQVVRPTASGSVRPQLKPEQRHNHSLDGGRYGLIELEKAGPLIIDDREPLTFEDAYKNQVERPLLDWKSGIPQHADLASVVRSYLN